MRRRLPVRWRLTAWNAGFLVTMLIVFGITLYTGLRFFLFTDFEEQVRTQSGLALAAVRDDGATVTLEQSIARDFQDREHFVRLLGADGSPIADPGNSLTMLPVDPQILTRAQSGTSPLTVSDTQDGTMVYVTTAVTDHEGKLAGFLQTGASRDDIDQLLKLLAIGLILGAPVLIAIAVGGGYLLARNALRPVSQITDLADSFDAHDLHARLDLGLPDDELGRLARTFDAMLARIEDAFTRQRRFTDDAAHELRTPLSVMRSQVDLALSLPRTHEEYQAAFQELDHDLSRLTRLVETLLSLARSDQHGLRLERSQFDVAETVALLGDQYEEFATGAGLAFVVRTTPCPANLDEDLIIQLLVNLLDNALANTPPEGRIILECQLVASSGTVHIRVQDSGIGISAEHHLLVFDRFYRVDQGRTHTQGGTGLGLAISKSIVEAHGGEIVLSSTPGVGTTIDVRLPTGNA